MTTRATTTTRAIFLTGVLSLAFSLVSLLASPGRAAAASNPSSCLNDVDCVATPQCGGDVCDYNHAPTMTCKAAGTDPKGADGWCTVDTDCKCYALGARCVGAVYCSFTLPSQAPDAGATGTGGTTGTTGGGGGGGCSVAGAGHPSALALGALGLIALVARRRTRARR
jgi:MYXO-CTERM domain-containing protein